MHMHRLNIFDYTYMQVENKLTLGGEEQNTQIGRQVVGASYSDVPSKVAHGSEDNIIYVDMEIWK